jgi:hypothetical protein
MRYLQILSIVIPSAYSWGGDGHNIIVSWAKGLMSDKGRNLLTTYVGGSIDDLSKAATWADTPRALAKYPQSESHHFSHTPYRDCREFQMDRDCGFPGNEGECIVTGLADAIELALDTTASFEQRQDAFKFILHFMGDIHQPLHVGFREDFGGTAIKLKEGRSLHEFWDNELIAAHKSSIGGSANWQAVVKKYRSGFTEAHIIRMKGSHDMKAVLSSYSEVIKYAAWLASDTAVTSTCKFGYVNEAGRWIESGQDLTDKYIQDRTPVMILALSKAAVRLAHVIDGIAIALEDNKDTPPSLVTGRKDAKLFGTKMSADPTFNRYEILHMDSDDIEPSTAPKDATDELKGPDRKIEKLAKSSRKKKRPNKKGDESEKSEEDGFEEVLAQLESEKRNTFEGVNLLSIQVIESDGVDLITSIENAKIRRYQPPTVITFRVAFDRNGSREPKMYFFDGSIFVPDMSTELAVRCILKVSGVPVDGESNIDRYWTRSGSGTSSSVKKESLIPAAIHRPQTNDTSLEARVIAKLEQVLGEHAATKRRSRRIERYAEITAKFEKWKKSKKTKDKLTIDDMWIEEIEAKKSRIAGYQVGSVFALVLEDTLREPGYRMRFSIYTLIRPKDSIRVIVDPAIFEGELSKVIMDLLTSIANMQVPFADLVRNVRPTWMTELEDVDIAMNGKDADRNTRFRVVTHIGIYDSEYRSSRNLEWTIKGAPVEVIYPPGFDRVAVTERIITDLAKEETDPSEARSKILDILKKLGQ